MKLHLAQAADLRLFSGYGPGYVSVNQVRHENAVVVTPQTVMEWRVNSFDALTVADFAFIGETKPEVVVFGTGETQRFPPPDLARALAETGVGVEVMDTRAACRTYNILAAEGRRVAAAVLVG